MTGAKKQQSRIVELNDRVTAAEKRSDRKTFAVPFREKRIYPVVIEVALSFPMYNVRSGRTHRAQSRYIDEQTLQDDFFVDPEDKQVQKAQHEILLGMVDEKGLAKDLIDKSQKDPIVLTYDGFIIDGNRRVAALKRDGDIEYVQAVVLPEDATDAEIYETEVELQMAAETKAPYNWIDEALHIKYGVERLYEQRQSEDALHTVAMHMNMDDDKLKAILERLSVVDLYLEWLGQPGKYHLIPTERGGSTEQAFIELADRMCKQQYQRMNQSDQRAIREACFATIADGAGYMDVRRVSDQLRKKPEEFLSRLKTVLPPKIKQALESKVPKETKTNTPEGPEGLLGELAKAQEDGEGETPVSTLLTVVSNPTQGKESGAAIMVIASELDEEERERRQAPDIQVQRALKIVQSLKVNKTTPHLDKMAKLLAELIEQAEDLANRITELHSEGD